MRDSILGMRWLPCALLLVTTLAHSVRADTCRVINRTDTLFWCEGPGCGHSQESRYYGSKPPIRAQLDVDEGPLMLERIHRDDEPKRVTWETASWAAALKCPANEVIVIAGDKGKKRYTFMRGRASAAWVVASLDGETLTIEATPSTRVAIDGEPIALDRRGRFSRNQQLWQWALEARWSPSAAEVVVHASNDDGESADLVLAVRAKELLAEQIGRLSKGLAWASAAADARPRPALGVDCGSHPCGPDSAAVRFVAPFAPLAHLRDVQVVIFRDEKDVEIETCGPYGEKQSKVKRVRAEVSLRVYDAQGGKLIEQTVLRAQEPRRCLTMEEFRVRVDPAGKPIEISNSVIKTEVSTRDVEDWLAGNGAPPASPKARSFDNALVGRWRNAVSGAEYVYYEGGSLDVYAVVHEDQQWRIVRKEPAKRMIEVEYKEKPDAPPKRATLVFNADLTAHDATAPNIMGEITTTRWERVGN